MGYTVEPFDVPPLLKLKYKKKTKKKKQTTTPLKKLK